MRTKSGRSPLAAGSSATVRYTYTGLVEKSEPSEHRANRQVLITVVIGWWRHAASLEPLHERHAVCNEILIEARRLEACA